MSSAGGQFHSSVLCLQAKGRSAVVHVAGVETQVFWDALSKPQELWAFLSPSERLY